MRQVLGNLLDNATKFTPSDGRIQLRGESRDGDVVISVSDTGPGIPADEIPKLFEAFWQGAGTHAGGAGLGLPISKGIVEAHGGRMWVESNPGTGSTFFFSLPKAGS